MKHDILNMFSVVILNFWVCPHQQEPQECKPMFNFSCFNIILMLQVFNVFISQGFQYIMETCGMILIKFNEDRLLKKIIIIHFN